ncbi:MULTISPECIES: hypothetical protein [unclassified Psychrobacter]|uniref:hypothetical protein n=1 Tax=unclassified Psychrobacter TaxID=196806 RepID=UPI003FD0A69F
MFAAVVIFIIIWISMWGFYKFMYPRAPKSMMPKEGDVTTPRICNFCGHSLAEYRGVVEHASPVINHEANATTTSAVQLDKTGELFFCNYEHQADFHAGKTYC